MADTRFPVQFGAGAWILDMARTTTRGRAAAQTARRDYEVQGVPLEVLRPTRGEGPDGTVLPNCVKTYLPFPAGPFGMVFELVRTDSGLRLIYLAFGVRHHPPDSHADSVYRIAHRRLRE